MNWIFVLVCLISGAWMAVGAIAGQSILQGIIGIVVFVVGLVGLIDLCSDEDPFDVEMRED
jgi:hypothetical protein